MSQNAAFGTRDGPEPANIPAQGALEDVASKAFLFFVGADVFANGTPSAGYDLVWCDPGGTTFTHSATGLTAFASTAATTSPLSKIVFNHDVLAGNSFTVDDVTVTDRAGDNTPPGDVGDGLGDDDGDVLVRAGPEVVREVVVGHSHSSFPPFLMNAATALGRSFTVFSMQAMVVA